MKPVKQFNRPSTGHTMFTSKAGGCIQDNPRLITDILNKTHTKTGQAKTTCALITVRKFLYGRQLNDFREKHLLQLFLCQNTQFLFKEDLNCFPKLTGFFWHDACIQRNMICYLWYPPYWVSSSTTYFH